MIKRMIALALVLMALAGCESELGGIDLTAANNGQTIDVPPNQTVNIKLDSNITTGFKWNLVTEPNSKIFKLVSSKYNDPNTNAVGAGGSETWVFQATGTGTTTLTLGYYRPFETNPPAKTFTVTVHVQ